MSVVWDVTHSYERILSDSKVSELKIDNEFSLLLSFGYRVYDGSGNYVEVRFKRGGSASHDSQKGSFLFLKNHMIVHHKHLNIGGTYYDDIDLIAVWEKGKGVKISYESSEASVDIVLNCSTTPVDNGDGTYSCGNLVINPVTGSFSISGSTITISGAANTLLVVSIGIGSKFNVENNKMGIANQDGEITATSVSKGIKITLVGGATAYYRADDFPQLYELIETVNNKEQHGGQWAFVNSNGIQMPFLMSSFGTTQRDTDSVMRVGYNFGHAFRSLVYAESDSGFSNTYFPMILPTRVILGFKNNLVGFAFEGEIRRANDTKIAEVAYSVTIDLANAKAIVSRSLDALDTFVSYQEGGSTMSLTLGGSPRQMTDGEYGVKVYNNGSWSEYTAPASGYTWLDAQALEIKFRGVYNIDLAEIVVPRSLRTNRSVNYRVGIAFHGETEIYPLTDSQWWNSGDYIKEIYLTYHGGFSDYGTTLESRAEIPSSLDSYDFTKVINDSSTLQAYGFDDGLIYDSDNDTYRFASETGNPHFTITNMPSSLSVSPSENFTISVTVSNDGTAAGSVEVRLKDHNGTLKDSKTASIDAGGNSTVTLSSVAPSNTGTYNWTVEAYNETTSTVDDSKTLSLNVSSGGGGGGTTTTTQWDTYVIIGLLIIIIILLFLNKRQV